MIFWGTRSSLYWGASLKPVLYKKESGVCGREEGGERNELDLRDVRATIWRWPANRTPITHAKDVLSFFLFCLFLQKFPNQRLQLAAVVAAEKEKTVSTSFTPFLGHTGSVHRRIHGQMKDWSIWHLACVRRYTMF